MTNTIDRPIGTERRNEVGKGLLGASIGFAVAGPFGAAIGGFVGAQLGSADDNRRKAEAARPVLKSFAIYDYDPAKDDLGQEYMSTSDTSRFHEVILTLMEKVEPADRGTIMVCTKWSDDKFEFTTLEQMMAAYA